MLLISSVLMTAMTQPTPLKMTNETYEYRVGLMLASNPGPLPDERERRAWYPLSAHAPDFPTFSGNSNPFVTLTGY